jgi:hypothetical protein
MLERLAKCVQKKSIDNEIHHSIEMHQVFKVKLGLVQKRLHMQKLTEENQRLLRRIQEVPPAYNHLEWEEDAKRLAILKRTMALYPEYYERMDKEEKEKAQSNSGSIMAPPASPPKSTKMVKSKSSGNLPPIKK